MHEGRGHFAKIAETAPLNKEVKGLKPMPKEKNLNAVKHGAYSEMIALPGEDREEFEALHRSLKEEFDPQGPAQEDRVETIAHNLWRKRRRRRYETNQIVEFERRLRMRERREDKRFEAALDALEFVSNQAKSPISEEDFLASIPHKNWAIVFQEHMPRKNYKTDDDWLLALREKIESTLDEYYKILDERGTIEDNCIELEIKISEGRLAFEERSDAKLDKDIVSFGRMKTMEAMGLGRRRDSDAAIDRPMKQVVSPPIQSELQTIKDSEDE
jgi:hypothetical protein